MAFVYKIADSATEFEQIHQLNYRTFAEEIPQHEKDTSRKLKDKFHDENTYIICLKDERVIGMIAVRSNRPFSLDGKIGLVENHLPFKAEKIVEIRLLAIEKAYRNGRAFLGLAQALVRYCLKAGYEAALISGTTREQKLYGQLGFQPFASSTGTGEAVFQPMYLTRTTFDEGIAGRLSKAPINFLPGPATVSVEVKTAMVEDAISHRSNEFEKVLLKVKSSVTTLTGANYVQLLQGTGTLANDAVAAQLSLREGKGLILINGEFGTRLKDHALRFGLEFDVLEIAWGVQFKEAKIAKIMQAGHYKWLWAVHCETSTGIVNELHMLKRLCEAYKISLAIDSVSSIGSIPVDLSGVTFASGVSGKGLLSYTGLAFVFHDELISKSEKIPRYIDLGTYAESNGIPYTQSTNLVSALEAALRKYENAEEVFSRVAKRIETVKKGIEEIGLPILCGEQMNPTSIITLVMPDLTSANRLGDNLYLNGYNVHYESDYLKSRNWLQISCMNDLSSKDVNNMLDVLRIVSSE